MLKLEKVIDNVEQFNLNKSYRSTKEIMEYANNYLNDDKIVPLVRSGEEVIEKEFKSKEEFVEEVHEIIHKLRNEGLESIAIVCKNLEETKKISIFN
jgi:DNA helicase-2/ATP-dependent DNA helicase PcrA